MVTQEDPERAEPAQARHFAARSVLGLAAVIAAGLVFGLLLLLTRLRWGPLQSLDGGVADGLNDLVSRHQALVGLANEISVAGGRMVLFWLVGIALVLLLFRRQYRLSVYLAVTMAGALLMDPSVKTLVGRLRPVLESPVAHAPGNSFPSGHALDSMVVYGALVLVFLPLIAPKWRKIFIGVPIVVVVLIGLARISLGVHFLSDVLGGWLLGAAWLGSTAYAFRVWRRESGQAPAPLTEGLEPDAERELRLAPAEEKLVAQPWAGAAVLVTGWVLTFGLLYVIGYSLTHFTPGRRGRPSPAAGRAAGRADADVVLPVRAHRRDHLPVGVDRHPEHAAPPALVAVDLPGPGDHHAGRRGDLPDVPRRAPPDRHARRLRAGRLLADAAGPHDPAERARGRGARGGPGRRAGDRFVSATCAQRETGTDRVPGRKLRRSGRYLRVVQIGSEAATRSTE